MSQSAVWASRTRRPSREREPPRRRGRVFARVMPARARGTESCRWSWGRASRPGRSAASSEQDDAGGRAIAHAAAMLDRISALRWTLPVAVVVAVATIATPAVAQSPSGTGSKNAGESANIWDGFLGFLGWVLLALGVAGFLLWMLLGRRRDAAAPAAPRRPAPADESAPPGAARVPAAAAAGDPTPATRDLTVLAFARADGAERAFGDVCSPSPGGTPWARDLAFVECHHRGRIVVRGTFAGHWVDVEDVAASAREGTTEGAVAETVAGVAFGPPAFAGHLAAGGSAAERAALLDTVRAALPEQSSGIVALATAPDADAMITAFDDRATRVSRHRLSPGEADGARGGRRVGAARGARPSALVVDLVAHREREARRLRDDARQADRRADRHQDAEDLLVGRPGRLRDLDRPAQRRGRGPDRQQRADAHERLGLAVEPRLRRERRPGGQHGADELLVVQRQAPQLLLDPVHYRDRSCVPRAGCRAARPIDSPNAARRRASSERGDGGGSEVDEPEPPRARDRLGARRGVELAVHGVGLRLDRVRRHVQAPRDLAERQVRRQQAQHPQLGGRQRRRAEDRGARERVGLAPARPRATA